MHAWLAGVDMALVVGLAHCGYSILPPSLPPFPTQRVSDKRAKALSKYHNWYFFILCTHTQRQQLNAGDNSEGEQADSGSSTSAGLAEVT